MTEEVEAIREAREAAYGSPKSNMSITLKMAQAYFGDRPVTQWEPCDVAMFLIITKQGREAYKHTQDNLKDISGYSDVYLKCKE